MEFVPGTNVIIGASDAGKSAVFRAINWVISNRPLGDAFRSEWGGDTTVALYTTEGNVVKRVRSGSKNEYIINGRKLTAFGHEVPEEVSKALQLDVANIQAQMDQPFLLAATPGEAARLLNKAASIDDIDHTIAGLRKSYTKVDESIKQRQSLMFEYNQQIEQYANLPILEAALEQVETLEAARIEKEQRLSILEARTLRAGEIEKHLKTTAHIPALIDDCVAIEKQHSLYQNKIKERDHLSKLIARIWELSESIAEIENAEPALAIVKGAEQLFNKWKTARQTLKTYKQLVGKAQKLIPAVEQAKQAIQNLENEYHELAPERCPLCGNKMSE